MTQPRSDVVLFNFVYGGPKPYLAPSFQLFLKSAEYSGADIMFVGDTPPPVPSRGCQRLLPCEGASARRRASRVSSRLL